MKNCIFCKILKGDAPATKVYEDDKTFVFLDASPVSKGHTLVIPKKHFETMDEMDEETSTAVMNTTKKIAKIILKFNEGYNVNQNNKPAGGQIVPHVHYHVIPRNSGDGFLFDWPAMKLSDEEFLEIQEKIQSFLK